MVLFKEKIVVSRDEPFFEIYKLHLTAENGWKKKEFTDTVEWTRTQLIGKEKADKEVKDETSIRR